MGHRACALDHSFQILFSKSSEIFRSNSAPNAEFLFCFLPHWQTASCIYGGSNWFPIQPNIPSFFCAKCIMGAAHSSPLPAVPKKGGAFSLQIMPISLSSQPCLKCTAMESLLWLDCHCILHPSLIYYGLVLPMPLSFVKSCRLVLQEIWNILVTLLC